MSQILQLFILLPLLAFLVSMVVPKKNEQLISAIGIGTTSLHLAGCIIFIIYWIINGCQVLDIKHIILYKTATFEFFIDFYFDSITAVFAIVGTSIISLVSIFSRYYLHRDEGFKRFFNTLLLFFLGYNLVIFSGNFETLFIGWEILGFCSFLLIAFYRDRYLPVKNALKVISVYRLGDVCLMLAMWMAHHLFHMNIPFHQMNELNFIGGLVPEHAAAFIFISVMVLIAAAAKSAVLPFSSWLPRAMEGPTTSSAVFYGSLSIHLGAFLLLRTHTLWENLLVIKIAIIVLGVATSLIAASIASVQSTVKTQIAYSSVTQIGLIFIEVAFGFQTLALIHFAGNAFLRTYQLLVSSSVLSYEIHDMAYNYKPKTHNHSTGFINRLKNTIYVLGLKEWELDTLLYSILWRPFKWIGIKINLLPKTLPIIIVVLVFFTGLISLFSDGFIPADLKQPLTYSLSTIGLLFILKSFADRIDASKIWVFIITGQAFLTLAIATNEYVALQEVVIYFSGIVVGGITGYICLLKIRKIDNDIKLDRFHGYSYERPLNGFIFLLSSLALIGFPFTPTFLGIDLLFTHIHPSQVVLIISTSLSFLFIELAILRIYSRVYLGQHKKIYHPIAYRSS